MFGNCIRSPLGKLVRTSVVIPTRGRFNEVCSLAQALLNGCHDGEIIIVSDGFCEQLRQAVAHLDERVVFLEQKHAGSGSARNAGARVARGETLVFMDDDVNATWEETRRVAEYARLKGCAAIPRILYGVTRQRREDSRVFPNRASFFQFSDVCMDWPDGYEIPWYWGVTCTFCIPRSVFEQAGGFDSDYPFANYEDLDFSLRLAKQGCKIHLVGGVSVKHWNYHSIRERCVWALREGYSKGVFASKHPSKADDALVTSRYGGTFDIRATATMDVSQRNLSAWFQGVEAAEHRLARSPVVLQTEHDKFIVEADRLYLLLESMGYRVWTTLKGSTTRSNLCQRLADAITLTGFGPEIIAG